jgi:hypothetical protein
MTHTLLLVGSPRGRKSTSTSLANHLAAQLQEKAQTTETLWITEQLASPEKTKQMMDSIQKAHTIVLTAPLYDDSQPYIVTKTMELMEAQKNLEGKRFIPIINNGFPQPEQITHSAIPIYKLFAAKTGLNWIGSLAIGAGEGLQGATGKSLHEAGGAANTVIAELQKIAEAISTDTTYHDNETWIIPQFMLKPLLRDIIIWINNKSWKTMAKKNGENVDAKPYIE